MEDSFKSAWLNSDKLSFNYFINLALSNKVPWKTLDVILDDLTPTLDKSKQLNKALLKELQNQTNVSQDEQDISQTQTNVSSQSLDKNQFETEMFENEEIPHQYEGKYDEKVVEENELKCKICDETFENMLTYEIHAGTHEDLDAEISENENREDLEDYSNDTEIDLNKMPEKVEAFEKLENNSSFYMIQNSHLSAKEVKPKNLLKGFKHLKKRGIPLQCETCGKQFQLGKDFRNHVRLHTGEKPYQCMKCGKFFRSDQLLRQHFRIHSDVESYKCRTCEKTFKTLSSRWQHERTHSGEKPYDCKTCNKRFALPCNLKAHQIIHTDEKPFKCDICNKSFNQSQVLSRHKKTHFKVF